MANKSTAELTAGTFPDGTELAHGVQGGNSRKFTFDQLRGYPEGGTALLEEGDLLYVNGDGEIDRLPKGGAGQVLKQNAGLTAPEWDDLETPGVVVLASNTVASASTLDIDLSSYIADGFRSFELDLLRFQPATDGVYMNVTLSTNGGSSFLSANYRWQVEASVGGTVSGAGNSSSSLFTLAPNLSDYRVGNSSGEVAHIKLELNVESIFMMISQGAHVNQSTQAVTSRGAYSLNSGSINAIRFAFSSGNISSGKWVLRGKRES